MKYFDSGTREPSQTLARWFEDVLQEDIIELRIQTGYFSLDGIGLLAATLERAACEDRPVKILVGSNDGCTLYRDLLDLAELMGVPRPNGNLGVVSFRGGYFHPKTYHLRRSDGSQAAFIGSANLTAAGLNLHVEAGIALDTHDGDDAEYLSQIALAIDSWFTERRDGLTVIDGTDALYNLVDVGVLAVAPPPRTSNSDAGTAGNASYRPQLKRLGSLPPGRRIRENADDKPDADDRDLPEEALQEEAGGIDTETSPAPAQTGNYTAFLMTLQRTDVGVGQTTKGASRRSPEIFIPLAARNTDPEFWGWPDDFIEDASKAGKFDRTAVKMRLGGTVIDVNMMTWPDKSDFRLRSEYLRSAGNVGDILYMERSDGSGGFTYYVEVIPYGSARYTQYEKYCSNPTRNSKKTWGYV